MSMNWGNALSSFAKGYAASALKKQENATKQTDREATAQERALRLEYLKSKVAQAAQPKEQDFGKILMKVMAGFQGPETIMTPEQMGAVTPPTIAQAEGGSVLAPAGSRFDLGEITSPTGARIGEYAPGYEPTMDKNVLLDTLRQSFGVDKQDAINKVLGLPKKKEQKIPDTLAFRGDAQKAMEAIEQGADKEAVLKKLTQAYPDKANQIQMLKFQLGK